MSIKILKGNIVYSETSKKLKTCYGYLVVDGELIEGVYETLPECYQDYEVKDLGDRIIIPGLYDLHLHAPQFPYRGLGLDMQLMEWLDTYAFPTEARFSDLEFAEKYYDRFVQEMAKNGTCRAVIFSSIHSESTKLLMNKMEQYGVGGFVGKINMDMLCPDYLNEGTDKSLEDTERWILETKDKYDLVKPCITPRFIPTCSSGLLQGLGKLANKYNLATHSHISEDIDEMKIVHDRYPELDSDGEVYDKFGLLTNRTVMAHCIYPTANEMDLLKIRGVTTAHCPQSNGNVAAGIPPIRKMLNKGINIGLGSDISGGYSLCIFRAMSEAVYLSKLKWLESKKKDDFLSVAEVFYMATKAGGKLFGNVGSFEKGYIFDALVLDDSNFYVDQENLTIEERLERIIHLGDDRNIVQRYVSGKKY